MKKLKLNKETVSRLQDDQLNEIKGGLTSIYGCNTNDKTRWKGCCPPNFSEGGDTCISALGGLNTCEYC